MEGPESVVELTETLRQGGYLADRGLATALFVAMSLNRPILLEGEVGVGKTEVAKVMASVFGRKLIRPTVDSRTPDAGQDTPRRGYRRVEWIESALMPWRRQI